MQDIQACNLWIGSDSLVSVAGLQDARTAGDWITGAAVVASVHEQVGGAAVAWVTVTLTYAAGTAGRYEGYVPAVLTGTLAEGCTYYLRIYAERGRSRYLTYLPVVARYRGAH